MKWMSVDSEMNIQGHAQADNPDCLRPSDVTILSLISYIYCNLWRLTSPWFKWSQGKLHNIPNVASFYLKLGSTVSQINIVHFPYIVCVLFCDLMGLQARN